MRNVLLLATCLIGVVAIPARALADPGQVTPGAGLPPRDQPVDIAGGASIRGRVVDAQTGIAVRRATVRATSSSRASSTVLTDREGRYEITDLPAGSYNVSAGKAAYVEMSYGQRQPREPSKQLDLKARQTLERIDFALPRGGVLVGRVLDEFGEPASDIEVSAMRMMYSAGGRRPASLRNATTNDIGEFRIYGLASGDYILSAATRQNAQAPDDADRSGYAPTYYPGSPNLAEARLVRVTAGQTLDGLGFSLWPTRLARVSGMVFDERNQPVTRGSVSVMQVLGASMTFRSSTPVRPDGSFTINSLPPGQYRVASNVGGTSPGPSGTPPVQPMAVIDVNGVDLTTLRLEIPRPFSLRGRLIFDPQATSQPRVQGIRIIAGARTQSLYQQSGPGGQLVREDLTFEIPVFPGLYLIGANGLPAGWRIHRVLLQGMDVTQALDITGNVDDLEVELTNRIPELSGLVVNDRGEPQPDCLAIVFSQDPQKRKWSGPGDTAIVRTNQSGRFQFKTLRGGDYYVVAVSRMEGGEFQDPEYQDRVIPFATRVTLADGETKAVDLKVHDEP